MDILIEVLERIGIAVDMQDAEVPDLFAAAAVNRQMMYLMPILTVVFGYQFPAGLTLYWLVSTLFSLGQQLYFFRVRKGWKKSDNAPVVIDDQASK